MDNREEKIRLLEEQISELPIGYISRKNINGKIRFYHQWTENGKKKSRYLDDESAAVLAEKIQTRRDLQAELKKEKILLKTETYSRSEKYGSMKTNILYGERLSLFVKNAASLKCRPCLGMLQSFLRTGTQSRILILFGLRRTGKTTLIQQAIAGFTKNEFDRTAFIQINQGDTMADLNRDLKQLQKLGFQYVFVDEATLLKDFIEGAALFSDIYAASGMKIVLSGTDSLGFVFASDDQLYDRCEMIHTTFIPYREFEEVLGIRGIDEYIRYGGTMSLSGMHYNRSTFSSEESTEEYIESAIARNIQHSLKYYQDAGHFRHLQELYEKGELTNAINRIVEDINHQFTMEVLLRDFVSHDLGISARNLRKDRSQPTDILDQIDQKAFTTGLKNALEIRNRQEQSIEIREIHRQEIREYLDLLDLIVDIPVQTIPYSNETTYQTVISQPGLRYAQATAFIHQLLLDESFQNISARERKRIQEGILDEIKGRMMEEIVLLETKKAYPEKSVFKLKFAVGEFDMVVCDEKDVTCEIYEIKHSKEQVPAQYRHLINEKKCSDTAFRFGDIIRRCVIYRGQSDASGQVEYMNVEEYLKGL